MALTKISIVGTEGSGKTVFLAVLANSLASARNFPRITGENLRTRRYTAEVMDCLESGKWPPSTPVDVKPELKWRWHSNADDSHELGTFDCAGQDFRAIFEAENDTELSDTQRALRAEFYSCDLVLLLLNLQDALDIYQMPGREVARIEIGYAPSAAVRRLRRANITLYAVFTQSDLYEERIRRDWNGDYSAALSDVLPDLYNALTEAGSQYAVVRAVETEIVDGKIVPKKEKNTADLGVIVGAVDNFFAKRKEEATRAELALKEAAAREKAAQEKSIRDKEEQRKKQLAEENRKKAELAKREAKKQGLGQTISFIFLVLLLVAIVVGSMFGVQKYNAEQDRVRLERKAVEDKAADARRKRYEEEQGRLERERAKQKDATEEQALKEKEQAERVANEKKAEAAAAKLAEEKRIREEKERAERVAREEKEAAEAKAKFAEEKRIREEKERAERVARNEKATAEVSEKIKNAEAFRIPDVDIDMQPIPAGSFAMGSPKNEQGRDLDETQHQVTISNPFWLGRYEVTQAQWESVMGNNPSHFKNALHPVESVSWTEAKAFCDKITETERAGGRLPEGYRYTLPTEAEWEYACRAGSTGRFAGSENMEDVGWNSSNSGDTTHPVGQKKPNAWGLYDMHGNVWEWCRDWFAFYPGGSATDPIGPYNGVFRIRRGGSWDSIQSFRSAFRNRFEPDFHNYNLGFRLALSSAGEKPVETNRGQNVATEQKQPEAPESPATPEIPTRTRVPLIRPISFPLAKGVKLELLPIAPGTFVMGSPANEEGRSDEETQHRVTISKPYWLGKHPVTQKQWEIVMGKNPSKFTRWFGKSEDMPVENVSWNEAMEFCRRLTEAARRAGRLPPGYRYILPTEAEWEYACRAGTTEAFAGNGRLDDMGWSRDNGDSTTHPVGQKQPNAWGFYDMHGNVWEWCRDWAAPYPDWSITDPIGPARGTNRVLRGGSWTSFAQHCRSAFRSGSEPGFRRSSFGFRIALSSSGN